ncbi:hydroxymethylglutaryl-CoA synthase [Streptomyces diastaticus]|uniref:Hydroxymethylglutaryl-CoA synthase n=2 Tax=Streptomyces TaxID=1883 RepID=A0A380P698_STRGR|nr:MULTISPECIES: hydroxymethylglutaryl-CoA synthase [Streptomyces]NEE46676.1 hydroxymethylglutaryl-CoA synthase family protein [Streptomyces sp. SID8455]PJM84297.1 3-hydroxy-3-methylglutaryl-ACP synthase [Streptomyces sp. TSRI0384-2]QNE84388.1 3-hydroxy-3-methylglutaryl-ACP synthase [Streptomyces rutgersensis]WPR54384.1 hydroxymethylglutaryl-CoA synthase [Streptomyces sp. S399]SUP60635.1 hydroxymethylglutaryl-CoA synthase [Streptomyces griseus]
MDLGIEAVNAYVGGASLDTRTLFEARGLDMRRFGNLMMRQKSVNLPCEDAVTNAVNAAKPLVEALAPHERDRIELVIVGTESGLDFGKPLSTYVHDALGLGRRCRSFETKHACYGGTAALRTAAALLDSGGDPEAKALVVAADAASAAARDTYWEPSQGAGAVAMIVGSRPRVLTLDPGASGFHSYEVMDTLRPRPDLEAGDSDLSLLSYMTCLEQSYQHYAERVVGADIAETFDRLVLHTPFAGMVKGAHRTLLRKLKGWPAEKVEADFERRTAGSLAYCARVGNIYSAALYLALCSLVDQDGADAGGRRVGMFSYGSGCASEFYSGVVPGTAAAELAAMDMAGAIEDRHPLTMAEYEVIADGAAQRMCGVRDQAFDPAPYAAVYESRFEGRGLLVLDEIRDFHRRYRWT